MRRTPEAILVAHRMDPERRELYVEGVRDRVFLGWLLANALHPTATIREIALVDIDFPEGGEKGRLLEIARRCAGGPLSLGFFADADIDRLLGRHPPSNVWFTDYRDMEGYVLDVPCVDKVLRVGFASDLPTAEELLSEIWRVARSLGLLHVVSEENGLRLPFQRTECTRYVDIERPCRLNFRMESYVQALLQNAALSITKRDDVLALLDTVGRRLANVPDCQVVHGKSAFALLRKTIRCLFVKDCGNADYVLWTSFDRSSVPQYASLSRVVAFLSK